MTHRLERFNSLLRQEISELLQRQVKDPRLGSFISVTSVEISPDLSFAKVFVSWLGSIEDKQATMAALTAASGFFRHELGERMKARRIPDLSFRFDDTIEKADHVFRIMDGLDKEQDK